MSVATISHNRIAGFAALAIGIHVLESSFPSPLPGVKPGLANVVTLIVLFRYNLSAAVWVAGLRVLGSSLLLGSFMTPTFMLGASGAISSVCALAVAHWLLRPLGAGPVGLAVVAALGHMAGQFFMAWWVFVPHPGLVTLLPVLMSVALASGVLTGWLALTVLRTLRTLDE